MMKIQFLQKVLKNGLVSEKILFFRKESSEKEFSSILLCSFFPPVKKIFIENWIIVCERFS